MSFYLWLWKDTKLGNHLTQDRFYFRVLIGWDHVILKEKKFISPSASCKSLWNFNETLYGTFSEDSSLAFFHGSFSYFFFLQRPQNIAKQPAFMLMITYNSWLGWDHWQGFHPPGSHATLNLSSFSLESCIVFNCSFINGNICCDFGNVIEQPTHWTTNSPWNF